MLTNWQTDAIFLFWFHFMNFKQRTWVAKTVPKHILKVQSTLLILVQNWGEWLPSFTLLPKESVLHYGRAGCQFYYLSYLVHCNAERSSVFKYFKIIET
jgi:hypothetical protein